MTRETLSITEALAKQNGIAGTDAAELVRSLVDTLKAELTEEIRAMLAAKPPEALLWDAATTAKVMGISDRALWSLTFGRKDKGVEQVPLEDRIPHVRIGHRVFYDPADVRDYIKRKKEVSGDSDSSRVE